MVERVVLVDGEGEAEDVAGLRDGGFNLPGLLKFKWREAVLQLAAQIGVSVIEEGLRGALEGTVAALPESLVKVGRVEVDHGEGGDAGRFKRAWGASIEVRVSRGFLTRMG